MIQVKVDENEILKLAKIQIEKIINDVEAEKVFWNMKELEQKTSMCKKTMEALFFYDPRFPKKKLGQNWFFPAKETRKFLEQWFFEQFKN